MIKIKINKKILAILLGTEMIFSLGACSSRDQATTSISEVPVTEENTEEDVSLGSDIDINSDIEADISLEEEGFDYFSSDLVKVQGMVEENKIDEVKKNTKEVFVTGVDFIFYDREISGVNFDELTDEGKEITMNNLESLGDMVDQVVPGWREELTDKYRIASDFIGDGYLSGLDKIRKYLGDENYEALGNIKDKILGDVNDTYVDVKGYVKSWYEEFRSRK